MPPITPSLISSLRAKVCRDSLRKFVPRAWSYVEPSTDLKWNWHLDALCDVLEAVHRGEIKRLVITVPPGTMKSLLISVMFNAWEWAIDDSIRYLTFSYSDKNPIRDNRRLRSIVQSKWYKESFGVELASDQFAKVRFDTTGKGFRIASSVGGAGTGEHPHRIIIDDPIKAEDARSIVALDGCIDWFKSTVSTRIALDPAIIVVMQRLHMEDLAGYLMKQNSWETVCFPMRFALGRTGDTDLRPIPDKRDVRSEPGELLWPEMFSAEKVAQEELDLGPEGAAAQLDMNPIPEGGAHFKRHYFKIVDALPNDLFCVRGWDAGGGSEGGDYTAGIKIGETRDGDIYVCNALIDKIGDLEYNNAMMQTAQSDGKRCLIREEREPGSSGKSVTKAHSRLLRGYDYADVLIDSDKVTRARPFRAQAQAGNVYMLRGDWNEKYLNQMCSFPYGKHDDAVDGTSCAYNSIVAEKKPKRQIVQPRKRTR